MGNKTVELTMESKKEILNKDRLLLIATDAFNKNKDILSKKDLISIITIIDDAIYSNEDDDEQQG